MKNGKAISVLATVLLICACAENSDNADHADDAASPTVDFNYISVRDGRIRTLHGIGYELKVSGNFEVTKPKNRVDEFGGTPYKISLAAFISENAAIMIHAETVADLSAASDYSNLPETDWPDDTFRSSGHVCFEVQAEEVKGEHDLQWLSDNGFEPIGSILFAQYFTTSDDKNTEIVISILRHVTACDDESANLKRIENLKALTSVTKVD